MRVLIVGSAGKMGGYHKTACRDLGHDVSICDVKYEGYGISDYKRHIRSQDIDAVIIATPTLTHYEIAKYFIECKGNIKVFIEKPMCNTSIDAYILVELARLKNVQLMVGHIERFNPAIPNGHFTDTSIIRDITTIRRGYTPDSPSNIVSDVMIHDIDTVMQLLNCKVFPYVHSSTVKGKNFAIATLDYNGIPVTHMVDRRSKHIIREIRIATHTHYYVIDLQNKRITAYNDVDKEPYFSVKRSDDALRAELNAFFTGYNNALQSAMNVEICENIMHEAKIWKKE